jgi:membrane-associated phospholipid phosphatase
MRLLRCPARPPTPRRCGALVLIALLLAGALARPAAAQELASTRSLLWAGAALGGALLLDQEIRAGFADDGGREGALGALSTVGNALGRPQYVLPALGGLYVLGQLAGDAPARESATHIAAGLVAAGVANGTLKFAVGRLRPGQHDGDGDEFRPLSLADQWQSFPSGHTVVAFALAGAIAEEAQNPWVSAASYGTAAMVGWSRVYEDRHWASDVVAGAIVGTVVSRATVRWLHARRGPQGAVRISASPTVGSQGTWASAGQRAA